AMGHSHGEDHASRSYGNGKQLFTVANCVACHKLGTVGREFGPDLTKLDPKFKPSDILRHVLEPSEKIVENPLVKADPVVINKGEIEERTVSKVSIMPKGLLDKLSRDEILDLVSF